jgi:hypothetical protein
MFVRINPVSQYLTCQQSSHFLCWPSSEVDFRERILLFHGEKLDMGMVAHEALEVAYHADL